MGLGGQTVYFVTVSRPGPPTGYLGLATEVRSSTPLSGVSFQSVSIAETPEGKIDIATGRWQLIAPPAAVALAADSTGELIFDGNVYQIDGPIAPRYQLDGSVHHVMIMCKKQAG